MSFMIDLRVNGRLKCMFSITPSLKGCVKLSVTSIIPFEPRHDKTNKMAVRPAKTQISLGILQVRSESSLSACRKLGSLATH